jgi:biotin transport system substrate-specific component
MVVSAWVSIPIGPVPITLQVFVMVFALIALKPKECIFSLVLYLAMGAIGLPVFSSMRGGIGVIAGPTGGFLWGFLLGAFVGLAILVMFRSFRETSLKHAAIINFIAGIAFLVVVYGCGWVQIMAVLGLDPVSAFAVSIAPFIVVDIIKTVVAIFLASAVNQTLKRHVP